MSIFSNFLTSTNLEFISPLSHYPFQLTSLLTYPLYHKAFSLLNLYKFYAKFNVLPYQTTAFYTITMSSRSSPPHPSLSNFLTHYPTPNHTKTRKSSTFFLEFPQPNSWNLLNFFPGMNKGVNPSQSLRKDAGKKGSRQKNSLKGGRQRIRSLRLLKKPLLSSS
jgi:hypothetical protein